MIEYELKRREARAQIRDGQLFSHPTTMGVGFSDLEIRIKDYKVEDGEVRDKS